MHVCFNFGRFWESIQKVKIAISLESGPYFHCPKGSETQCFSGLLSERCPEHHRTPLLGVLCSISIDFGVPGRFRGRINLSQFWSSVLSSDPIDVRRAGPTTKRVWGILN